MNARFVLASVGKLLQVLGVVLLIPTAIAVAESWPLGWPGSLFDVRLSGFLLTIPISVLVGTILSGLPRRDMHGPGVREGFAIVTFGWVALSLFGCIPLFFYLMAQQPGSGALFVFGCITDAFFEIMSGFTTTGATILTDIEALPKGLLFWRSLTHWLGGMGIVTLALAIFPVFGIAAYQMFRGEVPGPNAERLKPRLAQTAKILWGVYAFFTFAEAFLLYLGGMTVFDSFCHAFGTMATGGFSTKNASIAAYNSNYIDWVVTVFMFFAGMNFMIHYHVLFTGEFTSLTNDREFHFYGVVILGAILICAMLLQFEGVASPERTATSYRNIPLTGQELERKVETESSKVGSVYGAIRYATFQVISLTTTTGYGTADFDLWPTTLRVLLVILMFFGGCAGSTGGGMKMIRVMVVLKSAVREIRTMVQPRLIAPVKVAGRSIDNQQVMNIVEFFVLFMLLFVVFTLLMTLFVPDFTTAITAVVATICNIGPGLAGVGATENYAWIPIPGKWILTACMLLGRLEVYTVLIALAPSSWKR